MQKVDHSFVGIEGSMQPALFDVLKALCYFTIDCSALLGSVLIISGRQFWNDINDASRNLEFQLIARLKTGAPAYASRDD